MKKLLLVICGVLLTGCLATENRKVEISSDGVAPTTSQVWWRTQYTADRASDNPWDQFVREQPKDSVADDMEFFENNVIRWPESMPPAKETQTSDSLEQARKAADERAAQRAAFRKLLRELRERSEPEPHNPSEAF
jgi:hypothetical protein